MTLHVPDISELERPPARIIWHWTGGRQTANDYERSRYHILIEHGEPSANVVGGVPIERNMRSLRGVPMYHDDPDTGYAAHAGGVNTQSIGIALCGMRGAVDYRPTGDVYPGPDPITLHQVRTMLAITVSLVRVYDLPVRPETVLCHSEVRSVLGAGAAKWNITWLPGFELHTDDVGPFLREQVHKWLRSENIDDRLYLPPVGERPETALVGDDEV